MLELQLLLLSVQVAGLLKLLISLALDQSGCKNEPPDAGEEFCAVQVRVRLFIPERKDILLSPKLESEMPFDR